MTIQGPLPELSDEGRRIVQEAARQYGLSEDAVTGLVRTLYGGGAGGVALTQPALGEMANELQREETAHPGDPMTRLAEDLGRHLRKGNLFATSSPVSSASVGTDYGNG